MSTVQTDTGKEVFEGGKLGRGVDILTDDTAAVGEGVDLAGGAERVVAGAGMAIGSGERYRIATFFARLGSCSSRKEGLRERRTTELAGIGR